MIRWGERYKKVSRGTTAWCVWNKLPKVDVGTILSFEKHLDCYMGKIDRGLWGLVVKKLGGMNKLGLFPCGKISVTKWLMGTGGGGILLLWSAAADLIFSWQTNEWMPQIMQLNSSAFRRVRDLHSMKRISIRDKLSCLSYMCLLFKWNCQFPILFIPLERSRSLCPCVPEHWVFSQLSPSWCFLPHTHQQTFSKTASDLANSSSTCFSHTNQLSAREPSTSLFPNTSACTGQPIDVNKLDQACGLQPAL